MDIGVSTACLYPMETEKALRALGEAGVRTVEVFLNADCEARPPILRELCRIRDYYGMEIRSVHPYTSAFEPFLLFGNYERRVQDGFAWYERLFEASAVLGAGVFVIHGDSRDSLTDDRVYFERFHKLLKQGGIYQLKVTQENVERCKSRSVDFILRMKDALRDDCHFVLDVKQCLRSGVEIDAMLESMGCNIVHIHLSDHTATADCLLPGNGRFDFGAFFKKQKAMGVACGNIVEVYSNSFQQPIELFNSYNYLKCFSIEYF